MSVKRIIYLVGLIFCSIIILSFVFISPIVKYVVQENSREWIGRKLKIEKLWINIFTGSIHLRGINLYEENNENLFFSLNDFYCNIELLKLFNGNLVISPLVIKKPEINVIQRGDHFNFDDLLLKFSDTTNVKKQSPTEPLKYFIDNIRIDSAIVNYSNTLPQTSISVIDINVNVSPVSYIDTGYFIKSNFGFNTGGRIMTDLSVNINTLEYRLGLKSDKVNLNVLYDYLKDYLKIQTIDGLLTSEISLAGNFGNPTDIAISGTTSVNNFSLIDTTGEKLSGFAQLIIDIDSVNTKSSIYDFNSIVIEQPYLKFAMYDDGYNFDRILTEQAIDTVTAPVEEYSNIFQMMATYIKDISEEYLLNEYSINNFKVNKGDIVFTDYTIEDKFNYVLDSMYINAENIDSKNERILISLHSRLNKSGSMSGSLSIDPKGFENMDIQYTVKDLLISDINPYSKYYVATPFVNGRIMFENKSVIKNNKLKSTNRIFVEKIKVGNKTNKNSIYDLPLKLAIIILRNPKGDIDLEIPVEGDLNDPSYKVGKVIWQVFKNLIVKAATAPFNLLASAFGGKEEDYKEIHYDYLQHGVTENQLRVLENLKKALLNKPDLGLELIQVNNFEDEVEHLALFYSKRDYLKYGHADSLTEEQQLILGQLSNKDSLFIQWLDTKLESNGKLISVQEKSVKYIGKEKLDAEVRLIMERRNSRLMEYFVSENITPDRLKISIVKDEAQITKKSIPFYTLNFYAIDNESVEK